MLKEEFIKSARKVHGNFYDYFLIPSHIIMNNKIKIKCKRCGTIFLQRANKHLYEHNGCKKCCNSLSRQEFIKRAKLIHHNLYSYIDIDFYNRINNKVLIKCNICKQFFTQDINKHFEGHGCPYCNGIKSLTRELFITKANIIHQNKYDYNLINDSILKSTQKIKIFCKKCNNFFIQTVNNHLCKHGCPICGKEKSGDAKRLTQAEFIKRAIKIYKNKYDYSFVDYKNLNTPIKILCNTCKKFFMCLPITHLHGSGCKCCNMSKGEQIIKEYLDTHNIDYLSQYKFLNCKDKNFLPFDFYLPYYNVCIEFQGQQHYDIHFYKRYKHLTKEEQMILLKAQQKRDKIKKDFCKNNNIELLEIIYSDKIQEKLTMFFKNRKNNIVES